MEHWVVVACIDLQHFHILTSNPSLKRAIGHCSVGCTGDWKLVQGLAWTGV